MTLEELKKQKALLKERIEDALYQFYDATESIECNVYGHFETEKEVISINCDLINISKRNPKVIINPIEL